MTSLRNITLIASLLFILSCQKEKSWRTNVVSVDEITYNSATIKADYTLSRNDNYVYVGICLSETADPTVNDFIDEKQQLDSDEWSFYVEGLTANTTYNTRSFIKQASGEVKYSENKIFKTQPTPEAPCTPEPGIILFNGDSYVMNDLYETDGDTYELSTSCDLGELTIVFDEKPTQDKLYVTVASESDLNFNAVRITGILGFGFTCFYGVSAGYNVYVNIADSGEISVAFCDLPAFPTGSCETSYILQGEVHQ